MEGIITKRDYLFGMQNESVEIWFGGKIEFLSGINKFSCAT
jgi:hypothetical protein